MLGNFSLSDTSAFFSFNRKRDDMLFKVAEQRAVDQMKAVVKADRKKKPVGWYIT